VFLGVSSPIVEVFVKGSVPRDVRLLAARGMAASVGCDRLALLALMTLDEDPEVSALASATIDALPRQALSAFFGRDDVPAELRAWFETGRSCAPATSDSAGVPDRVAFVPAPVEGAEAPLPAASGPDTPASVDDPLPDDEDEARALLTSLPVPDKIRLATLGRREQRAILIRDPNRIVATAVLSSPKLTDTEVENFARMQNVSDEVLRLIGTSRAWTKSYPVVSALVKNPRTPTAVSMPLLTRLIERDLRGLAVDRNVPESVRLAARKQLAVLQSRKQ
jgi:hypothetical protein